MCVNHLIIAGPFYQLQKTALTLHEQPKQAISVPCQCLRPLCEVVEVLLKTRAYVVKKGVHPGQISWGKNGGAEGAWKVALERSGW